MSDEELYDALHRLAGRGTPRGFDEVLRDAADAAEREAAVPTVVPGDSHTSETADLETIPFVSAEPPARRRRRPLGSMIAAAGIAALLIVGTLAVSAVVGNSGSGAGSAEAAVQRLADALTHEDPLAAADVLVPSEVRSLHGTVDSAEHKAAELKLVQTAGAPLSGVDFNVTGLHLSTQSLGDGFTKVTVDEGAFSASTHKSQFSPIMQKVLRNSHDNSSSADLSKVAADIDLPTFVVAVRSDGKWYVSAAYTTLEYVREYNHLPPADFGSGKRADATLGADSPDAAVQDAMHALVQQDWSKLISLAPPDELPVYDYRAALTQLANQSSATRRQGGARFSITSMTTDSQVQGDTAKVTLHAAGTMQSGTWALDGGCYSVQEHQSPGTSVNLCDAPFFSPLSFVYGGFDKQTQISVVKEGGRWFVSPVGTVLDLVDRGISRLDRRDVYSFLNIPNQLPPDGALTLGRPVVLRSDAHGSLQVLTFDGTKGQSLLGLSTSAASSGGKSTGQGMDTGSNYDVQVRAFGPDGAELDNAPGLVHGESLVLPVTGRYTVTLQALSFSAQTGDITVTIWNTADAPAAAKQPSNGETCTYTVNSTSCYSRSVTSGSISTSSGVQVITKPPTALVTPSTVGGGNSISSSATTSVPPGG